MSWRYRCQRTFFGLSDKYQENTYEQFFYLKYHAGFSLVEFYNLPIGLREWCVERLKKQKQAEEDADEEAKNGKKNNP